MSHHECKSPAGRPMLGYMISQGRNSYRTPHLHCQIAPAFTPSRQRRHHPGGLQQWGVPGSPDLRS
jgi:hypothetical protein